MIRSREYVRKPVSCRAVQVTEDNINQIIEWLRAKGVKAVRVGQDFRPEINMNTIRGGDNAGVGDYVLFHSQGRVERSKEGEFNGRWMLPEK